MNSILINVKYYFTSPISRHSQELAVSRLHSRTCYAPACRSELSLGGTHGAMLHGVADLLSGTRGCAVGPSVALLGSPFYCFVRFSLFCCCSCRADSSTHRSQSCLVPTRPRSAPKLPCLLVPRVQDMAHGQEACEYCELKPDGRCRMARASACPRRTGACCGRNPQPPRHQP
jgi:hypothetical protein